jgi:hypothetical protein
MIRFKKQGFLSGNLFLHFLKRIVILKKAAVFRIRSICANPYNLCYLRAKT